MLMKPILILAAAGAALTLAACSEKSEGQTAAAMPDTSSPAAKSGAAPDAGATGQVPPEAEVTGPPSTPNPVADQAAGQPTTQ
jgi:hypothetical protein